MSDRIDRLAGLSTERAALIAVRRLQGELDDLKRARTEPIAIIGMSCRFPGGANSPEAFWQLLAEGRDAVTEVPQNRYDIDAYYDPDIEAPGKMISRWGAFLDQIDQFDPLFFGISPREALYLDPQQRLLLEVTWEAMERAGLVPEKLAGSQTGVFIGLFNRDYFDIQLEQLVYDGGASATAYTGIGNGPSFAAGRISYLLGLHGPSMVIDTVCSSSLVAVHLACQSLRNGECTTAFAGATNLVFYPLSTVITSKMRALSPQGRCKTFDAAADGFVRGEGCGGVVLKRLSQALADGDPILALIRGSAVNHDGRSSGLTAPNPLAQQAVIRQALGNASVRPEEITFIETHGTGTRLGDPLEFEALRATVGQPRPDGSECVLGSVKTNIGHLEPAAGVAGLIKTVLCLQHGLIPPNLHFHDLNPHISLDDTPFVIPTALRPWPATSRRFAGVGGAGLSGTNAHVVLEEAPRILRAVDQARSPTQPYMLTLSARSAEALRTLIEEVRHSLQAGDLANEALGDICYTAALRRPHYAHRLALVARTHTQVCDTLQAFLAGQQRPGLSSGVAEAPAQGAVFIFSGQGAQWPGMGRQLLEQEPVFRATLEACDRLFVQYAGWSILDELTADPGRSRLDETAVAQAWRRDMQLGLAALWQARGIVPQAVVGHSVGEIAAAHIAGVLSLEAAITVVFHRGRLM